VEYLIFFLFLLCPAGDSDCDVDISCCSHAQMSPQDVEDMNVTAVHSVPHVTQENEVCLKPDEEKEQTRVDEWKVNHQCIISILSICTCHLELKYSIVLYCNVMLLASPAFGFGQDVCAVDSYSAKAKQQQPFFTIIGDNQNELVAELSETLTLTIS